MKKLILVFLSVIVLVSNANFNVQALSTTEDIPKVQSFTINTNGDTEILAELETRATGLIIAYGLSISKTGTTLKINGQTRGSLEIIRVGFKDLMVQRRKTSSDSWADYYEFGNVYVDDFFANLSTSISVASGYQYRVTCKHYAKKSLLVTQTISNTSNIVTVS